MAVIRPIDLHCIVRDCLDLAHGADTARRWILDQVEFVCDPHRRDQEGVARRMRFATQYRYVAVKFVLRDIRCIDRYLKCHITLGKFDFDVDLRQIAVLPEADEDQRAGIVSMLVFWLEHLISEGGLQVGTLDQGLALDLRGGDDGEAPFVHRILLFIQDGSVVDTWLRAIARVVCQKYGLIYENPVGLHLSVDGSVGTRYPQEVEVDDFFQRGDHDVRGPFDRNGNRVWFMES